ncbi:FAD-binding and (Fe-S)-binding domain-containing protein [Goodfellowiella coeruleoviolacea]|uniref:FAD/FMN-containing dehydrogenase n=1 Tax=Goodfellowiella coeruleoviolacea TaxID=334858 RepID=A0AAE3KER7_9PSEU|nr:FAD-binding and (Fe-S)-binding domain-containing protein [Goodfellowiella coeruleoviolacea]MCP2163669.1 FAD/FMN-containing dehydrogenase [Goodfellowiella coeruleoviolacea]
MEVDKHQGHAVALAARLRRVVAGEVSDSTRRRAEYSTDASNYRVVPEVVVLPRDTDDVLAALDVARREGVALTCRGGGTSIAGNAIGPGIVLDFSRHLNHVVDIDPGSRTAVVRPGVVLADLQRQAAAHGLRFGPDPSSHARATLAGMIGNNACGAHAVAYGRTADNVRSLDVVDGTGRRFTAATGLEPVPGLAELVHANLEVLRTELGRFPRQGSGYALEHLLPERGRSLARALVGTEGTVAITLGATLDLVPISPARVLVVLGYPDMFTAADAVPALLDHAPLAVEGLDARLVEVVRQHRGRVPDLPRGGGWLMIEVGGDTAGDALRVADALIADAEALDHVVLPAGPQATALWRIREDGAGLAGRSPAGRPAWPGWEDAAVPPERLGGYLREFDALMTQHGVTGLPYGHFGDGCVHVRIDIPLESDGSVLRAFLHDAARLVAAHGGSLSGEHGDGRARGELLSLMYSDRALAVFQAFKALFDPDDVLNPGVLVRPRPVDADLRRPRARPLPARDGFAFGHDGGDFTNAVHRCVGVGKCRADTSAAGGFMCPSFLATRDEKDTTRGRARVLQDMANGSLVTGGWSAPEVAESLELCLSCKACASDCPAGVDMARYKAEVLHRSYAGRLRPASHYSLGQLPRWLALLNRLLPVAGPAAANAVFAVRPLARALLSLSGVDSRRRAPRIAPVPFARWWRRHRSHAAVDRARPPVLLWVDSFSNGMSPEVATAAVEVLTDAGYRVVVPERSVCCGLTWISTGQLTGARRRLRQLVAVLGRYAEAGMPIVGLEPSCTAVLRSDLVELLPGDAEARRVADAVLTLAELLSRPLPDGRRWQVPDLSGVRVLAQPHCHQHAVMGYEADLALLTAGGARTSSLAGCCGLAGNFGMERGHYEVSVAVAENALLPALRDKDTETVFLADGFSCRTQAEQLAGVRGVHLAQLLAARLRAGGG